MAYSCIVRNMTIISEPIYPKTGSRGWGRFQKRDISGVVPRPANTTSQRGTRVINGLRTSLTNITMDGINIQDNFIRTSSNSFLPTLPLISQVSKSTRRIPGKVEA